MQIDLNNKELANILREKYGEATFRVFYIEDDKEWEARNNKKISELKEGPEKRNYVLYF